MRLAAPLAAAVALALGATAGSAAAIPWDRGGATPPSSTPPPVLPDPDCRQSYANDAPRGGPRLRFGIGPRPSGQSGTTQSKVVPGDPKRRWSALRSLRGRATLAVRLNRLFMADGRAGIRRFVRIARGYARRGYEVELQVRYHPAAGDEGDIAKWLRYVRQVVRAFGPIRRVTGLQITNEVNLTFSPNTSDGAYPRALEALVDGVVAAKRESRRRGFGHQRIGFNYAWRFDLGEPSTDAAFWRELGRLGGRRLRAHTDWVGVDAYPGTFAPGLLFPAPIVSYEDALLEALAQTRECFMPKAGFTRRTPLRLEEIGYATGPGRSESEQLRALRGFVRAAHRYRGTYGLTDFRWFNLRDNDSSADGFDRRYGLLRDDYSRKPAFETYRRLIARHGHRP